MINSDQAQLLGRKAKNETAVDSPRLDEESRFKVAFWHGFDKQALLDSEQVELLALQAKRRDPVTLSNPRIDEDQQVGKGSGATR